MLIYNFQKEFVGIDSKTLQELGYHDLEALQEEVADFADLFVKTPGYIYNFQHVHWIDFIDCADDGEIQKVVINANGKNFTANILITNIYLTENPTEKAYLVNLNSLRSLADGEVDILANDISNKPMPTHHTPIEKPQYQEPIKQAESIPTPTIEKAPIEEIAFPQEQSNDLDIDLSVFQNEESIPKEIQELPVVEEKVENKGDIQLDILLDEEEPPASTTPPAKSPTPTKKTIKKEKFDNGYIYDPEVASSELGLPVDLIEEFIQDFIAQAKEFKSELYSSCNDGDIANIKSLSHKLKGVAANLRVADALEVLTTINTTSDMSEIKPDLDLFYNIISKLSGEEIEVEEIVEDSTEYHIEEEKSEDISLDFKDDNAISIEQPLEVQMQEEKSEDIALDFKDDNAISIEPPLEVQMQEEKPEDIALDFKDDNAISIEPPLEVQIETEPVQIEEEISEDAINISYSKEKVANEIGIDLEIFNELFEDYIDETNIVVQEIENASKNNNFDLIHFEIRKFKGMNENMRINSFDNELEALLQTTNQEESLKLIHTIQNILDKLSKVGA